MAASDTRSCMLVAEAATQIVLQKLDILLSRPVCIECLSMRASMEDAKAKLATIQDFISTQYRPSKTTEWSGRLLQAMNYAEEFIDKFQLRKACKRHEALHMAAWPLAALVFEYKLRRDLSILVNKMEGLCDEKFLKEAAEHKRKNGPASSSSHRLAPWQGTKLASLTSFWDRYVPIISLYLQDEKKKLMKWMRMQQGGIQGTSIFGRSGTGKAILARWAHSQAKYMDYERRAYVHISAGMDKRQFLFEILKQVEKQAREMKDMDIKEIKAMLSRKLAEMKRFLIVLDEVQQSNEPLLRELAMILPFSSQGHLIYTTQDDKIAQYMSTSGTEPIKLEDMDVKGSRRMLAWELHGVPDGGKLSDEEKKILEICPAVPLCISLIGGFLSNAAEHERAALAKEGSMMTLSDVLQLSCHKLPVHLKPCFIYMALFPVTFPIPTRRLVRLWLADGLLNSHRYDIEGERTRKPEDVGAMFILELARRDGSPKTCQMVVPLHEMIRPIAMSVGFLHIHASRKSEGGNDHDPTSQQQQPPAQPRERTKVRWLVEHANIVTVGSRGYPNLNLRHVSSFLSFHQRRGVLTKDISTFLRKMTSETDYSLLRVLDLEGVYKPSLQGVLPKLVLLRYLGLRSTVLDSIPREVADLHYLETLDIKHTNITSLPSSLWKARNLRHLHLNWFYVDLTNILKACRNNVNALTKLQTLSGLVIGEVKEDSMTDHMNSLTTLKLFLQHSGDGTSGAAGKIIADWISLMLINLQSLTFGVIQEGKPAEGAEDAKGAKPAEEGTEAPKAGRSSPLPELSLAERHRDLLELYLLGQLNKPIWTLLLPGSLRVLTLSGSKVEADMMPLLGDLLKNLRTLRLFANSFLDIQMRFAKGGFPSLQFLKIWKLPRLQEVIIEKGALLQLKELEFRHLDAMKNVEGINMCQELKTICVVVKKGAHDFVNHLKGKIGKEQNLRKIEEAETTPESMDNDEDNRYGTILNLKHDENVSIYW
ncbi:hypothetical protein ACJRO7_005346 [Eucalyptus globulus]|uniref:NB-ARC domain-containing protein n=1 Tax=Eucalyptus globulus TaxID=34317 RepID=A0ABD3IZD9_EUCGL